MRPATNFSISLVAICLACLASTLSQAAMYRCTDASGKQTFSDMPCEGEETTEVNQSDLPPLNASTGSTDNTRMPSSSSSRKVYRLQYPDGSIRTVTKSEYEAQMKKNKDANLKKRVAEVINNTPQQQRENKAMTCSYNRKLLASGKLSSGDKLKVERFLNSTCGGV